jgi:hypothetical protein
MRFLRKSHNTTIIPNKINNSAKGGESEELKFQALKTE